MSLIAITYFKSSLYLNLIQRYAFSILLIVLFFPAVLPSSANGQNASDTSKTVEGQYLLAREKYTLLKTDTSLKPSRKEWLKNAREFRKTYLASPKSVYAPNCLFMLGKIYKEMFVRFNNKMDIDEALSYFNDAATIFPHNRLGDDSLWIMSTIYLDDLHNPKKAAKALRRIVTDFPKGDMHIRAVRQLKVLSQQHNVSLPQVILGNSSPEKLTQVLPVRYWSSNDYTRVVVNASGPVKYKEELLEQSGDQPRRLFIDFFNSYIAPRYRAPIPIEDGLLKRVRTGQYKPDTVRVVLDIQSISSFKVFSLPNPFRVIIDVRGKKKQEAPVPQPQVQTNAPQPAKIKKTSPSQIVVLHDIKKIPVTPTSMQRTTTSPSASLSADKPITLAQQLGLGVKTIVLDPGHGGKDPGAIAFGLKEKNVVLKVAKILAPILEEKLGCKVILTRKTDVFIPLEERTAVANTHDADLFVSLHINANPSQKAYGIETYFLNLTTNPEAMRVAAFENATSTHQMSDLQNILSDILKNSKINESSRLAEEVHNAIITGLQKNYSHIKNLGVKQAPFYVLIGAEMPAILVEMSFISNKNDAQHLKNDHFLHNIATDISSGIQSYISTNTASL